MWRVSFFLILLFINNAFAKSCLRDLPSGHHAVVASYDEAMRCIIKSCIVPYKLFHNKCIEKTQYEELIEKEKNCVESGGNYDYLNGTRLKCFCPDDKFSIDGKCISPNEGNCDYLTQYVEINKLDSVKKCVEKNNGLIKGLAQPAIESAIKTHDYRLLDYLLDNGLDLEETTHSSKYLDNDIPIFNLIDYGVYSEQATLWHAGNPEHTFEQMTSEYTVDLRNNFDLIKHLINDKKVINLKKQYATTPSSKNTAYFLDIVVLNQNRYASGPSLEWACKTLEFLLQNDALYKDIMQNIIIDRSRGARDHSGFPFEYLKCARDKGIKFKLIDGGNPLDHLMGTPNLKSEQYNWLITEVKKDLPNVNFTNALRVFCEYDYSYGPPPRKMEEEIDIIKLFLDAGAQINDDVLKAAKYKQEYTNKNVPVYDDGSDNSNWFSHKFDAVCSFVPENEICFEKNLEEKTNPSNNEDNDKALQEAEQKYKEAKAKEQSLANRTLTAATTAATGIGGMQLAQGLAEQKADKEAERDMEAYIATFRCEYGNGKSVKGGMAEIELPGGNDETLIKLRNEYFTLANDLKERKEALGMKPGIESEVILDKAQMGLYDNESTDITGGAYSSLYRAKMLGSETDQTKIDEDKEKSKKRVIAGGVLSGVGVAGGVIGNSLINGKLGEMIKDSKNTTSKTNTSVINKLKKGLKSTGMTGVDKLDFSNLDLSSMSSIIDKIDFSSMSGLKGKNATDILNTSNSSSFTSSFSDILGNENMSLFQ